MTHGSQAMSMLGAIALLAGCGLAPSGPATAPEAAAFAQLDADHDGYLSPAEAGLPAAIFQSLDSNHDGRLSWVEFLGAGPSNQAAMQTQLARENQQADQTSRNPAADDAE